MRERVERGEPSGADLHEPAVVVAAEPPGAHRAEHDGALLAGELLGVAEDLKRLVGVTERAVVDVVEAEPEPVEDGDRVGEVVEGVLHHAGAVVGVRADPGQALQPAEGFAYGVGVTAAGERPVELRPRRVRRLALRGQLGAELPYAAHESGGEAPLLLQLVNKALEGDLQTCVVGGGGGVAVGHDLLDRRGAEQREQHGEGEDQDSEEPGADGAGSRTARPAAGAGHVPGRRFRCDVH